MTDSVKELSPQIGDVILRAQRILMCCHPSPDPDSIGTNLAMMFYLESLGKQVILIAGDSEIPVNDNCLPGYQKILPQNFLQTDLTQYDLFIALDVSSRNQISKLGPVEFPNSLKVIVIDHHTTNEKFGSINLVDTSYIATGEIVFDLFTAWGVGLTYDMAANLYLAIYTDSGGFKYRLTSVATYEKATALVKLVPDFADLVFAYENQNEPQRLYYEGLALSSIRLFFNNRVAVAVIPYEELTSRGIKKIHTEKTEIANQLKSVIGWDIGITLVERDAGVTTASFRTRNPDKTSVAKIAQATGLGGGHPAAAGATFPLKALDALPVLLKVIATTYPELGSP